MPLFETALATDVFTFLTPQDQSALRATCRAAANVFDIAAERGFLQYYGRNENTRSRHQTTDGSEYTSCVEVRTCAPSLKLIAAVASDGDVSTTESDLSSLNRTAPTEDTTHQLQQLQQPPRYVSHQRCYPFDPKNAAPLAAESVVADMRFFTYDVSRRLRTEMIKRYCFDSLRAVRLRVVGLRLVEEIGFGFLEKCAVQHIVFGEEEEELCYSSSCCASCVGGGGGERLFRAVDSNAGACREIDSNWMSGCEQLISVDFGRWCLSSLEIVGDRWLSHCSALKNVTFSGGGLSSLRSVGCGWMANCQSLQHIHFAGGDLTALEKVGVRWLANCDALLSATFHGMRSLKTVGFGWLCDCKALETALFVGLEELEDVGSYWMGGCASLLSANFRGLGSLTTVGSHWLSECECIDAISFGGLPHLRAVGCGWLAGCKSLKSVDFSGLVSLEEVAPNWLLNCPSLEGVSFGEEENGLSRLRRSGQHAWLVGCRSLPSVDFSGIGALEPAVD